MEKLNINKELPVVAIPNAVLFHGGEIKVKLNLELGKELYKKIEEEDFYAIALTVKNHNSKGQYDEEDFYQVGTLIKIEDRIKIGEEYEYNIDVIERVEVKEFKLIEDNLKVNYDLIPDIIDIDEKEQKQILEYIKTSTVELSKNFRGSETYVEYIMGIDNIPSIIAYLIPYINLSPGEKQEFFEIRSLKGRSLRMLDLLIEHKASIEFQIELSNRVTGDINKNYKETILRKQLEAIQEE